MKEALGFLKYIITFIVDDVDEAAVYVGLVIIKLLLTVSS